MPSKDVTDGIKTAHGLTTIIDQLTEPVAKALAEQLSPLLRHGEALPDLELIQRLMSRLVVTRLKILMTADEIDRNVLAELDEGIRELLGLGDHDLDVDEEV